MSYLEHFKLEEQPFRLTPDPEFVYWSKQHARAKAYMESTIWLADGFVVITGEVGSGKTTLLQTFLSELEEDIVYAVVSQTQLTATQFLQAVLTEFGFKPFNKRKVELLDMLNMFLPPQLLDRRHHYLTVDLWFTVRKSAQQRSVTKGIDEARYSTSVSIDTLVAIIRKQVRRLAAGDTQPVLDIFAHLLFVERTQVKPEAYTLHELSQARRFERILQFRLAGENDA